MAKDKDKEKKEPEPIDKIKEREQLVESASNEIQLFMLDVAGKHELSSAEVFAILSEILASLGLTAMQNEHEEYFGPESEERE